eukprot:m51a1_g12267 hypothetical protein (1582) ;mRNA; r:203671-211562
MIEKVLRDAISNILGAFVKDFKVEDREKALRQLILRGELSLSSLELRPDAARAIVSALSAAGSLPPPASVAPLFLHPPLDLAPGTPASLEVADVVVVVRPRSRSEGAGVDALLCALHDDAAASWARSAIAASVLSSSFPGARLLRRVVTGMSVCVERVHVRVEATTGCAVGATLDSLRVSGAREGDAFTPRSVSVDGVGVYSEDRTGERRDILAPLSVTGTVGLRKSSGPDSAGTLCVCTDTDTVNVRLDGCQLSAVLDVAHEYLQAFTASTSESAIVLSASKEGSGRLRKCVLAVMAMRREQRRLLSAMYIAMLRSDRKFYVEAYKARLLKGCMRATDKEMVQTIEGRYNFFTIARFRELAIQGVKAAMPKELEKVAEAEKLPEPIAASRDFFVSIARKLQQLPDIATKAKTPTHSGTSTPSRSDTESGDSDGEGLESQLALAYVKVQQQQGAFNYGFEIDAHTRAAVISVGPVASITATDIVFSRSAGPNNTAQLSLSFGTLIVASFPKSVLALRLGLTSVSACISTWHSSVVATDIAVQMGSEDDGIAQLGRVDMVALKTSPSTEDGVSAEVEIDVSPVDITLDLALYSKLLSALRSLLHPISASASLYEPDVNHKVADAQPAPTWEGSDSPRGQPLKRKSSPLDLLKTVSVIASVPQTTMRLAGDMGCQVTAVVYDTRAIVRQGVTGSASARISIDVNGEDILSDWELLASLSGTECPSFAVVAATTLQILLSRHSLEKLVLLRKQMLSVAASVHTPATQRPCKPAHTPTASAQAQQQTEAAEAPKNVGSVRSASVSSGCGPRLLVCNGTEFTIEILAADGDEQQSLGVVAAFRQAPLIPLSVSQIVLKQNAPTRVKWSAAPFEIILQRESVAARRLVTFSTMQLLVQFAADRIVISPPLTLENRLPMPATFSVRWGGSSDNEYEAYVKAGHSAYVYRGCASHVCVCADGDDRQTGFVPTRTEGTFAEDLSPIRLVFGTEQVVAHCPYWLYNKTGTAIDIDDGAQGKIIRYLESDSLVTKSEIKQVHRLPLLLHTSAIRVRLSTGGDQAPKWSEAIPLDAIGPRGLCIACHDESGDRDHEIDLAGFVQEGAGVFAPSRSVTITSKIVLHNGCSQDVWVRMQPSWAVSPQCPVVLHVVPGAAIPLLPLRSAPFAELRVEGLDWSMPFPLSATDDLWLRLYRRENSSDFAIVPVQVIGAFSVSHVVVRPDDGLAPFVIQNTTDLDLTVCQAGVSEHLQKLPAHSQVHFAWDDHLLPKKLSVSGVEAEIPKPGKQCATVDLPDGAHVRLCTYASREGTWVVSLIKSAETERCLAPRSDDPVMVATVALPEIQVVLVDDGKQVCKVSVEGIEAKASLSSFNTFSIDVGQVFVHNLLPQANGSVVFQGKAPVYEDGKTGVFMSAFVCVSRSPAAGGIRVLSQASVSVAPLDFTVDGALLDAAVSLLESLISSGVFVPPKAESGSALPSGEQKPAHTLYVEKLHVSELSGKVSYVPAANGGGALSRRWRGVPLWLLGGVHGAQLGFTELRIEDATLRTGAKGLATRIRAHYSGQIARQLFAVAASCDSAISSSMARLAAMMLF